MKKIFFNSYISAVAVMLISLAGALSQALENTEELELDLFKNSMGSEEMMRWSQDFQRIKIHQKACEIQIASHLLPLSCYRTLALQVKLYQEIKNKIDRKQFQTNQKISGLLPQESDRMRIDKSCLAVVREMKELMLERESELLISKSCLIQAREKIKINRYKAGLN